MPSGEVNPPHEPRLGLSQAVARVRHRDAYRTADESLEIDPSVKSVTLWTKDPTDPRARQYNVDEEG